jgi:heat shock protein HslJ
VEITFSVDDASGAGRLAGSGGVNRIAGGFDVAAARRNAFKPTPIIATKMAGPPEAMLVEDRVMAALNFATRFRRQGDRLILADNASDLLIFRPAPSSQPED